MLSVELTVLHEISAVRRANAKLGRAAEQTADYVGLLESLRAAESLCTAAILLRDGLRDARFGNLCYCSRGSSTLGKGRI